MSVSGKVDVYIESLSLEERSMEGTYSNLSKTIVFLSYKKFRLVLCVDISS